MIDTFTGSNPFHHDSCLIVDEHTEVLHPAVGHSRQEGGEVVLSLQCQSYWLHELWVEVMSLVPPPYLHSHTHVSSLLCCWSCIRCSFSVSLRLLLFNINLLTCAHHSTSWIFVMLGVLTECLRSVSTLDTLLFYGEQLLLRMPVLKSSIDLASYFMVKNAQDRKDKKRYRTRGELHVFFKSHIFIVCEQK